MIYSELSKLTLYFIYTLTYTKDVDMINPRKLIRTSAISCAVAFILGTPIASAIEITSTLDAEDLANALIIPNSGLTLTSASLFGGVANEFFGEGGCCDEDGGDGEFEVSASSSSTDPFIPDGQAGMFANISGVYGLPTIGGVVFSTGNVADYEDGPSTSASNTGGNNSAASEDQNSILSEITGRSQHFDPVQLDITFDVDAEVSVISFIAAFGSEEYPEFVGSSFVDGFGMFLNGVNIAGALPTGGSPGEDPLLPINSDHPDFQAILGTELDGVIAPNGIPLMRFDVPVEPGSTGNTFSLLLADAGDSAYDSTIFLSSFGNFESDSGESEFTPILPDPSNPTNEDGAFVFELPEVVANETIWIDPDVSIGYTYTATGSGLFASVTAPTKLSVNDDDGYLLTYLDGSNSSVTVALLAGQMFNFIVPVGEFTIEDIDPDLALDPTDPNVFVTGISFSASGSGFGILQAPITTFVPSVNLVVGVPEPSSVTLFSLSLIGMGFLRRKLKTK
jgi:hypothetical protein